MSNGHRGDAEGYINVAMTVMRTDRPLAGYYLLLAIAHGVLAITDTEGTTPS